MTANGQPVTGTNIISIIQGSAWGTEEDKILVVGAHWDTVVSSPGRSATQKRKLKNTLRLIFNLKRVYQLMIFRTWPMASIWIPLGYIGPATKSSVTVQNHNHVEPLSLAPNECPSLKNVWEKKSSL